MTQLPARVAPQHWFQEQRRVQLCGPVLAAMALPKRPALSCCCSRYLRGCEVGRQWLRARQPAVLPDPPVVLVQHARQLRPRLHPAAASRQFPTAVPSHLWWLILAGCSSGTAVPSGQMGPQPFGRALDVPWRVAGGGQLPTARGCCREPGMLPVLLPTLQHQPWTTTRCLASRRPLQCAPGLPLLLWSLPRPQALPLNWAAQRWFLGLHAAEEPALR